jgi:hypothetical protein
MEAEGPCPSEIRSFNLKDGMQVSVMCDATLVVVVHRRLGEDSFPVVAILYVESYGFRKDIVFQLPFCFDIEALSPTVVLELVPCLFECSHLFMVFQVFYRNKYSKARSKLLTKWKMP